MLYTMNKSPEKLNLKYFRDFSGAAVFALSVLWFYFPGEYVLIANQDNNLFLTSSNYFYSFLDHPGGIIEYIGIFLSQFFRFRFVGAIIISGIIFLGYFAVCHMLRRVSDSRQVYIAGITTAVILFGMQNNYSHQLHHSLGFVIVMFATLLLPRDKVNKEIFLLLSIPVIYFVCGAYLWVFSAIILAEHYISNNKIRIELIGLLIGYPVVLVILATNFIFLYPFNELLIQPFPFEEQYGIPLLQYIFVVWIILLPGILLASEKWKSMKGRWDFVPGAFACLVAIIVILNFTYDKKSTEFFRIEKYAVNEDWNGLLRYTKKHPSMNLFGCFYTNMALVNKGLLCSNLFDYPQPFGKRGLSFEWSARDVILKRGSDFFWTIHFVNEAHHWAFESMIVNGFSRRNLKRIIQTELIRGNYKVAEKFINVLDQTLFDREIADHYRKFLNNRDAIEKDSELGPRVSIGIDEDFFADGADLEKNLRSMLSNDPFNRPAFDYLMAVLLFDKNIDNIVKLLPFYLDLTEGQLPVLLDESLMVYRALKGKDQVPDIKVSNNTQVRYNDYANISRQYKDRNAAANALYPRYQNSFWFYLNFGPNPNQ